MTPLSICYVAPFIEVPNRSGFGTGGSAHALDVSIALQALGIRVELVCAGGKESIAPRSVEGVRTWPLLDVAAQATAALPSSPSFPRLRETAAGLYRWARSVGHARQIRRVYKASKCEMIYERANAGDFGGTLAAMTLGAPLVLELNDLSWKHISARVAAAAIAPSCDGLPASLREKAIQLSWGVNNARFSPSLAPASVRGIDPDLHDVFLHSSSCLPWHGLVETVIALSTLAHRFPRLRIVVLGKGPTLEEAKRAAAERQIADRLAFVGHVPYEQVPHFVSLAHVGLAPYSERLAGERARMATPIKVLEYMASGKPCLISRNANLGGIVTPALGWEIESADPASIANGIVRAMDDRKLWEVKGKAATGTAGRNYSWSAHATRLRDLFNEVKVRRK